MEPELLPAVNVVGIPKKHFDIVRLAAIGEGISDSKATVTKWCVVKLADILQAEAEKENKS